MNSGLSNKIRELEISLHQPDIRSDYHGIDRLLHTDFMEFGRSGDKYIKADTLKALPQEQSARVIWSQDFEFHQLAEDVVLVTYKSAEISPHGTVERHTLRSSVWKYSSAGWQMRFHQGTPTEAFEKAE